MQLVHKFKFTNQKFVGSLEMNVDVANDLDVLSERRQAIEDVCEVSEEHGGRGNRTRTVNNGYAARQ